MQSNVTLSGLGRFLLALGLAIALIVAGAVGPANEALADGGGPDTTIITDTLPGGSPAEDPGTTTGTSLAGDGEAESESSTTEVLGKWALKLLFSYWIQ